MGPFGGLPCPPWVPHCLCSPHTPLLPLQLQLHLTPGHAPGLLTCCPWLGKAPPTSSASPSSLLQRHLLLPHLVQTTSGTITCHALLIILLKTPPPSAIFPFVLTGERRLKPGSHPKLALARSRPSLTPSPHAPSSLEPWSHCFLIQILHWSGGACWVCGLSALHRLGQEGIG